MCFTHNFDIRISIDLKDILDDKNNEIVRKALAIDSEQSIADAYLQQMLYRIESSFGDSNSIKITDYYFSSIEQNKNDDDVGIGIGIGIDIDIENDTNIDSYNENENEDEININDVDSSVHEYSGLNLNHYQRGVVDSIDNHLLQIYSLDDFKKLDQVVVKDGSIAEYITFMLSLNDIDIVVRDDYQKGDYIIRYVNKNNKIVEIGG